MNLFYSNSSEDSDLSGFNGSDSDNSSVDSAGNAVLELDIDLGDGQGCIFN